MSKFNQKTNNKTVNLRTKPMSDTREIKFLYRYEIEYRNYDSDTEIRLRILPVIKETEKTWFVDNYCRTKRVLKDSMNTYAYDTKEKAKEHFIHRTKKRIKWFEFWKKECEKALNLVASEATK